MAKINKELKHDHKLTTCLKVILFSIVMLMPFLAIGTTSLYVICNKNAKDNYEGDYTFNIQVEPLKNSESYTLIENINYRVTNIKESYVGGGFYIPVKSVEFKNTETAIDTTDIKAIAFGNNTKDIKMYDQLDNLTISNFKTRIQMNTLQNNTELYFYYADEQATTSVFTKIKTLQPNTTEANYLFDKLTFIDYKIDTSLSAVFYAQTNRIWEAPLFNWVMKGPFYTSMTAFTNLFGIPNQTFFSNLLVYWLTMICIYIIIDVVLEIFIWLSHLLFERKENI